MSVAVDILSMSAGDTITELKLAERGFTITKEISTDGEHLQVELNVESSHDDTVTVELAEQLPPGTQPSEIGFLPNNEPRASEVTEDDTFLLDTKLVPYGTRTVIYGIKNVDSDEVGALQTEPTLLAVTDDDGQPVGATDDAETEPDAAADTGEAGETTEPSDSTPPAEEADTDEEPSEPQEEDTADEPAASDDSETEEAAAEAESESTDSEADANESEEEDDDDASTESTPAGIQTPIDDETAKELAAALEPHMEVDAVTETKLSQMQDDVADIRGYLPAMEEFLGDTGRADEISSRLDDLSEEMEELGDVPDELDGTIDELQEEIEAVEATASAVEDQLEDVSERLDELEDWRDDIADVS
jgi:hypothetical protein